MNVLLQELVSEKLKVQQQNVQLERVNGELEKAAWKRELLDEHTLEDG